MECVHSDISAEKRLWCASTGLEDYARREINVNFYTSMIWQRCLSAISTQNLVSFYAQIISFYRSFCSKILHLCFLFIIYFLVDLIISIIYVLTNIYLFVYVAGECSNKECPFLHIDPESKIKDCPWYDRGFCKHGESLHFWNLQVADMFKLSYFKIKPC